MYALIAPIRRLPKHIGPFSYTVPDSLEKTIRVGQLVRIPFSTTSVFGVVLSLQEKLRDTSVKVSDIRPIESIVYEEQIIAKEHLALYQTLAHLYGVSISTILKSALLPLQPKKLTKISLNKLSSFKKKETPLPSFIGYTNEEEHATILHSSIKGTTLILVPEHYLIDQIYTSLDEKIQKETVTWHSSLSTKEQFTTWLKIRNSEARVIIGTRGAVMLPYPHLDTIIVDYEHHEQHKHWDQAPRFHAKDMASMLSQLHGAALTYMSFSPSIDTYHAVHHKLMRMNNELHSAKETNLFSFSEKNPMTLVNMRQEQAGRNYSALSFPAQEAIEKDMTGDIFLFLNRKGYATSVGCTKCPFVQRCSHCDRPLVFHEGKKELRCHYCRSEETLMRVCPDCGGPVLQLRGPGTELIEQMTRTLIGARGTHDILRIDANTTDLPHDDHPEKPRAIIGTTMALPYVRWDKTSLVIFVDIDHQLALPELSVSEDVWSLIQSVNYYRTKESVCLIQTQNPEHVVLRSLNEPDRFYRTELHARQQLSYPPYKSLVRYMITHVNKQYVAKDAEQGLKFLNHLLTKHKISATLAGPIELSPRYYRHRYWYAILAKFEKNSWLTDVAKINRELPSGWKIDPHPISILSP